MTKNYWKIGDIVKTRKKVYSGRITSIKKIKKKQTNATLIVPVDIKDIKRFG